MKAPKIDQAARRDIDKLIARILRDAGFQEPPIEMNDVLSTLKLDREFYDLEDPGLLRRLRHSMLIGARRLSEFVEKVRLQALILFDDRRVLLDQSLPTLKHDWALAHEAGHELIPWHRPFSRGDSQDTLDPAWHEQLEAEANYAASALLFCGQVFTMDARDTVPCWASIEELKRKYLKNLVPTARRYVERGPEYPMLLLVSTAAWDQKPASQATRVRHLVLSPRFEERFKDPDPELLRKDIDSCIQKRRGGPVGAFEYRLLDRNGETHLFHVECFYNRYYVISLFVHRGTAAASVISPPRAAIA